MPSLTDAALEAYAALRRAPGGAFVAFALVGGEIDVVEEHLPESAEDAMAYEMFVESRPSDEAQWIAYNLTYETTSGGQRLKVVMVKWVPGDAPRASKMAHAMWTGAVKASVEGIHCNVQACARDELEFEVVLERASRFERDTVVMP